jgi:rhodanese-related sulfurtransferase
VKPKSNLIALSAAAAIVFSIPVIAEGEDETTPGNRYDKPRYYHSEISASEAYLLMEDGEDHRGYKSWHRYRKGPVLIDVRRLREYAAGHPEGAYNVPYPHIINNRDQDDDAFIDEVYRIVRGDYDRQIMLLCRTGSRSVDAGNLLAEAGFTHVQNIWEGFVGQYKYAYDGGSIAYEVDGDGNPVFIPLDLNNDGEMNDDMADVYEETADYNPDKDGWRNFMGLPWTKKLRRHLVYENDIWQYFEWMTPVSGKPYDKYRWWGDD